MKVLGVDEKNEKIILEMKNEEWKWIQGACGIPYDKYSRAPGMFVNAAPIDDMQNIFFSIKTMRKELAEIQKKWDKLACKLDSIIEPQPKVK